MAFFFSKSSEQALGSNKDTVAVSPDMNNSTVVPEQSETDLREIVDQIQKELTEFKLDFRLEFESQNRSLDSKIIKLAAVYAKNLKSLSQTAGARIETVEATQRKISQIQQEQSKEYQQLSENQEQLLEKQDRLSNNHEDLSKSQDQLAEKQKEVIDKQEHLNSEQKIHVEKQSETRDIVEKIQGDMQKKEVSDQKEQSTFEDQQKELERKQLQTNILEEKLSNYVKRIEDIEEKVEKIKSIEDKVEKVEGKLEKISTTERRSSSISDKLSQVTQSQSSVSDKLSEITQSQSSVTNLTSYLEQKVTALESALNEISLEVTTIKNDKHISTIQSPTTTDFDPNPNPDRLSFSSSITKVNSNGTSNGAIGKMIVSRDESKGSSSSHPIDTSTKNINSADMTSKESSPSDTYFSAATEEMKDVDVDTSPPLREKSSILKELGFNVRKEYSGKDADHGKDVTSRSSSIVTEKQQGNLVNDSDGTEVPKVNEESSYYFPKSDPDSGIKTLDESLLQRFSQLERTVDELRHSIKPSSDPDNIFTNKNFNKYTMYSNKIHRKLQENAVNDSVREKEKTMLKMIENNNQYLIDEIVKQKVKGYEAKLEMKNYQIMQLKDNVRILMEYINKTVKDEKSHQRQVTEDKLTGDFDLYSTNLHRDQFQDAVKNSVGVSGDKISDNDNDLITSLSKAPLYDTSETANSNAERVSHVYSAKNISSFSPKIIRSEGDTKSKSTMSSSSKASSPKRSSRFISFMRSDHHSDQSPEKRNSVEKSNTSPVSKVFSESSATVRKSLKSKRKT